jgi:hypothetical protein
MLHGHAHLARGHLFCGILVAVDGVIGAACCALCRMSPFATAFWNESEKACQLPAQCCTSSRMASKGHAFFPKGMLFSHD